MKFYEKLICGLVAVIAAATLTYAAIQMEVGINGKTTESAPGVWAPIELNTTNSDGFSTSQNALLVMNENYLYNGTTWDRWRSAPDSSGLGIARNMLWYPDNTSGNWYQWAGSVSPDQVPSTVNQDQRLQSVANTEVNFDINSGSANTAVLRSVTVYCSPAGTATFRVNDGATVIFIDETDGVTNLPKTFTWPTGMADPTPASGSLSVAVSSCGSGNIGNIQLQADNVRRK